MKTDRSQTMPTSHNKTLTADGLAMYFTEKVATIRKSTELFDPPVLGPPSSASLTGFKVYSLDDIRALIASSPNKTSALDPIPTFLVKEYIQELSPFITLMCNRSLSEGHLPLSQRQAVVVPILKKPNLDSSVPGNYRPISGLTFASKLIERLVSRELTSYLEVNGLQPQNQSAYRKHHSTETVMLQVTANMYDAADRGHVSLLVLLDQSAAFDLVDHDILRARLLNDFGVDGVALSWIVSFLSDRSQTVRFCGSTSLSRKLICGVPQGSVLGPLIFTLYSSGLSEVVTARGLEYQSYADDVQMIADAAAEHLPAAIDNLQLCMQDVDHWMTSNRLCLNTAKTELTFFGTRQQLAKITMTTVQLGGVAIPVGTVTTSLGVRLDSSLSMSPRVCDLVRTCHYHLRQIRSIRRSV